MSQVTIRFLNFLLMPNFIFCCGVSRAIANVLGKYFYFTINPLLSPPLSSKPLSPSLIICPPLSEKES